MYVCVQYVRTHCMKLHSLSYAVRRCGSSAGRTCGSAGRVSAVQWALDNNICVIICVKYTAYARGEVNDLSDAERSKEMGIAELPTSLPLLPRRPNVSTCCLKNLLGLQRTYGSSLPVGFPGGVAVDAQKLFASWRITNRALAAHTSETML